MASYSKNIASSFGTKVIRIITGFAISVMIARALGPEGKGYIAFFIAVFSIAASYGHFGINNATTYFQKRSDYSKDEIYSTNLNYLSVVWILLSGIFLALHFTDFLLTEYSILIIAEGILFVALTFFKILMRGFYVGEERIVEINKFYLFNAIFIFLGIVLTWWLNVLTPLLYIAFKVGGLLINFLLLWHNLDVNYSFQVNLSLLKAEFKYGLFVYFSALFGFLIYRMDQLLIKNYLPLAELGIYSVAVALAELVFLVPGGITQAIMGKLYNIEESDTKKKKAVTARTIKYTFYLSLLIAIIGFIMRPLIPVVYGSSFFEAQKVFSVLLVGTIFASIGKVSYPYFHTKGQPKVHFAITGFSFIINLILNLIFIPKFGILGAAYASVASYFFYGLAYLVYFSHTEKFHYSDFFMFDSKDIQIYNKLTKKWLR